MTRVHRTSRTRGELADGREIFFYDREWRDRDTHDRRDLPETQPTSQIRWDPLFRDHTTIAGHRQGRTYKPPADLCPLCPSADGHDTEIPSAEYEVVVFENRFPSYALGSVDAVPLLDDPPFRSGPGAGRCEVVCFASAHDLAVADLAPAHLRTVVDAWADRSAELARHPSIEYVFCFENSGADIGVTLNHPHGQIYGYPFVPPRFATAAESAREYHERTGRCLQCTLLAAELDEGTRIVAESQHWVCWVPFAARWPYEVRLAPRAHVGELAALDDAQRDDLAPLYADVLGRFGRLFDTPVPYIAGWQQAPTRAPEDSWHLAAEVITTRRAQHRLKFLAGSESGAGVWINDIAPELAAQSLRAAARG